MTEEKMLLGQVGEDYRWPTEEEENEEDEVVPLSAREKEKTPPVKVESQAPLSVRAPLLYGHEKEIMSIILSEYKRTGAPPPVKIIGRLFSNNWGKPLKTHLRNLIVGRWLLKDPYAYVLFHRHQRYIPLRTLEGAPLEVSPKGLSGNPSRIEQLELRLAQLEHRVIGTVPLNEPFSLERKNQG